MWLRQEVQEVSRHRSLGRKRSLKGRENLCPHFLWDQPRRRLRWRRSFFRSCLSLPMSCLVFLTVSRSCFRAALAAANWLELAPAALSALYFCASALACCSCCFSS